MTSLINTLLKKGYTTKSFSKNQLIFSPEEDSNLIFLITEGCAKVFLSYTNGKEFTLTFLYPGNFFSTHAETFVEAVEATSLITIPTTEFTKIIQEYPELTEQLLRNIGFTLKNSIHIIEQLAFKGVEARLAQFLIENQTNGQLQVKLSQEELAKLIGTSRPTISTLLNLWQKNDYILMNGRTIQIIDLNKLTEISQ